MSHEIETMAYTNEVPWHGLGFKVDNKQTVDSMMKAAKIDWKVEKQKMYLANGTEVNDNYALVRDSDSRVLDVVGNVYKPAQNADTFKFFKEYVEAGDAYMETAGSLRNGQFVWGLANLNATFKLKGDDQVKGYLLLMSPHKQGKSLIARFTTVRVVCNNTLTLALREGGSEFRMSHRTDFNEAMIEKAKDTLGIARDQMAEFAKTAEKLSKMKFKREEVIEIFAPIYQPNAAIEDLRNDFETEGSALMKRMMDVLERAPGAQPDNGWGVLNAVTYYSDHIASRTSDKRLTNAWIGKTANQKEAVLEALIAA